MRRLLFATILVLALPAFGAAMPMTEDLAAVELGLIDASTLAAPSVEFFPVETVISEAVEDLSLENPGVSIVEAAPDILFPTEIPTMPEVLPVPPVSGAGDHLPLPPGEGGGSVGGGGSSGGGSSGGSGSGGSGGAPGNSNGGGSSTGGGSSSGGGSGSGAGSGGSGGGPVLSIPTPSALFLVGSGLLGVVTFRRLRKR